MFSKKAEKMTLWTIDYFNEILVVHERTLCVLILAIGGESNVMVTIQAIDRTTNLIMVTLWTKDYFNEILIAHEGRIVSIDTQGFPHWRGIREFPHTSQKIAHPPARKIHTKKLPHYIKTSML